MTQGALAEVMGVEPPTVSRWEAGDRQPDSATLKRLADALGTSVGALFGEGGTVPRESTVAPAPAANLPSIWSMPADVPIYGTALGADLVIKVDGAVMRVEQTVIEPTQTLGYVRRPPSLSGRSDIYALYVVGSSMEPRFRPGERVYVDPRRPPAIGDDVIVQLRDHQAGEGEEVLSGLIKTLARRLAGSLVLEQYNPPGRFTVPAGDIVAVHRVIPWSDLLNE